MLGLAWQGEPDPFCNLINVAISVAISADFLENRYASRAFRAPDDTYQVANTVILSVVNLALCCMRVKADGVARSFKDRETLRSQLTTLQGNSDFLTLLRAQARLRDGVG